MPLLLRMAVEADIDQILDIQYEANDSDPWHQTLFPNGISTATRNMTREHARTAMQTDPHTHYVVVVDTDLNDEIIAFAKWMIYKQERPESEWNKADTRKWPEDTNLEAISAFFGPLLEKRRKYMAGSPFCFLWLLDTSPAHQRRGAGGMLVQWGTDIADEAHIPCYVEGTAAGYKLYRKKGFEDVDAIDMDLSRYGGKGLSHHACMIRPAKPA